MTEVRLREDRRRRKGDENPPTARATRMQGVNGGEGGTMGRLQTAEPPGTEKETAAEDGSTGPLTQQSDGANGTRSEHDALARCEYNLLVPGATEGGPANAGGAGSEAGHGEMGDQEGTEAEEEGGETLQRALPTRGHNGGDDEARGPPKRLCALNACGHQGEEEGGDPPPSSAHQRRAAGARGRNPEHGSAGTHRAARTRPKKGDPSPSSTRNPRVGRRGRGTGRAHPPYVA